MQSFKCTRRLKNIYLAARSELLQSANVFYFEYQQLPFVPHGMFGKSQTCQLFLSSLPTRRRW